MNTAHIDIINDPDFAGLVCQDWYVYGDERIQGSEPYFLPRSAGEQALLRALEKGDGHLVHFTARPVYEKTTPRAKAGGVLPAPVAEATYSAMCALNNVGARICRLSLDLGNLAVSVEETPDGELLISWLDATSGAQIELHANQAAFAAAYGLQ